MRRFLIPISLIVCSWIFWAANTAAQGNDSSTTRPSSTTWIGDTGLWFVPTGEILPDGKWSLSGYRANIDREQGISDISHFVGTAAVGINDRVEVFGSVRVDTRIRRAIRPFYDSANTSIGGPLQDYPFVPDVWNDDHFGDVLFGAKFNISSEHRLQPAALALRASLKAPTGSTVYGTSTGRPDLMFDFIVSKNIQDRVELSAFGGFLARTQPKGITLGNGIRWGVGAGFPSDSSIRIFTEMRGEVPLEDNLVLTTPLVGIDGTKSPLSSPIKAPVDTSIGLMWQSRGGTFVGVGLSYSVNQNLGTLGTIGNLLGLQVRIGRHPGVRRYVPPAPDPEPPGNTPPTVTAECSPCEVEPGGRSEVTANANDPDGDPLTYRWSAPAGNLNQTDQVTTAWTAPEQDGPVPVTVTVNDGRGGTASDTATIQVVSPPPPPAREYAFEDVHFDFDRYNLRPGAARILDEAIDAMAEDESLNLTIQGHTCNIGTSEYNQALGERRSNAVRDYLTNRGISAVRLQTVTFGEEQSLHDNSREETRRLNRRAALVVRLQ